MCSPAWFPVSRQRTSAGKSRDGDITEAGSKKLRWTLAEAAQSLCKIEGPYRNLCKRLERKNKGKGVAATACARKLLTENELTLRCFEHPKTPPF